MFFATVAVSKVSWIEEVEEEKSEEELFSIKELLELLKEKDDEIVESGYEGWLETLAESETLDEALNLAYSFFASSGVDAFDFFVERGWFLG